MSEALTPERDLLTVVQAAAYIHSSVSSIRAYIREGRIDAFRVAGRRIILIRRAEIEKLLEPAISTGRRV